MHYVGVVNKDAGSAYGVRLPDLPGRFSAADTVDEIIPKAIEALALYFEDREVVAARGIEAIRSEAAGELTAGAFLMMIPYISDRRRCLRSSQGIQTLPQNHSHAASRIRPRHSFTNSLYTAARRSPCNPGRISQPGAHFRLPACEPRCQQPLWAGKLYGWKRQT